jgi:glutamyl-Q tRNA(Asp) synthetase
MITRFAPSPTGYLHLGHVYSAGQVWMLAKAEQGQVRLRIEDIDQTRCQPVYDAALIEDLNWLGLRWHGPIRRQSEHTADYQALLGQLVDLGLVYPCTATRKQLLDAALSAPQGEAVVQAPTRAGDGALPAQGPVAWRLDIAALKARLPYPRPRFFEAGCGPDGEHGWFSVDVERIAARLGAVVLGRKDAATSYHIACVHDDALQEVTHVVRGQDLFDSAHLHVAMQALLGLPTPIYRHHGFITDASGKRLAKRDGAASVQGLRSVGVCPQEVWERVGLSNLHLSDG